ncbi:DUF2262 domain-containing protein [Agarivorans aestuarii]|uniref:DUF2262 domain-containing protein n=1 Tax=Agarivorans aestuarii TaxID=1563703 RepID=A0ABU7FZI6_9ALTE|nr:DUF2262 domain-containing protein [Agarivorans aestuarii]MEE1672479.1 DUF2262 domain-containing protein [Agarivorans aestuarii]
MKDIFKDAAVKKEKLEREFSDLSESIITGVVGTNGPGAGKVPADKYWSLNLSLVAWKELGGEINNSSLILSKDLTDDELKDIQAKVKSKSLVQFKVKLSKISPFGDARAQLISILDAPDDIDLDAALEKFKEPVEVTHKEFGDFILDKSVDWFEGNVSWVGKSIRVSVSIDEDNGSPEGGFKTIEALHRDASRWSKKITKYAVSELLELKNDIWLMEGQQELTAKNFVDSMQLESIAVYPDGEFEFWHNDGGLFWGHSILISGSLSDGPNDADIPG